MKLWGGRFAKSTGEGVDRFHASIGFDWRLLPYDVRGSQVHARALAKAGVLTEEEAEAICRALDEVREEIESGRAQLRVEDEDIHMNVERLLTERVGELGKKLHTARSRNDQVALDTRMYVRDALRWLEDGVASLQEALLELAKKGEGAAMPGYTHLQRAQPVLFAHYLLAYFEMFERDRQRLGDAYRRVNVCPLGSGALAGVTFPIDRDYVRRELGFAKASANSLDAVSDRDFILETLCAGSILAVHLSRLCEELVLWSSAEFGFIEFDDAFATGSSMMPQKKNPDVAELVRGKSGRVIGDLVALLVAMKGLPLAYNKDMQEDKEALFDAVETLVGSLEVLAPAVRTAQVRKERLAQALAGGFLNATDLADYLVRRGVPFREAHALVGRAVRHCVERGIGLEQLTLDEFAGLGIEVGSDVYEALSVEGMLAARDVYGGTAPRQVAARLAEAEAVVKSRYVPLAGQTVELDGASGA